MDGLARSSRAAEQSVDQQRQELARLIGQINPTVAALDRLDTMQDRLRRYRDTGLIDRDTYREYTQRIETMREAVGETAEGMNRAGMSARAYNAALRGLPAQFTDIAVSLQAGQAPLTVFLQQGGQLKDMFGGIGPAARAMGGYILGLINPFTLAAAAAATLAIVFYDAEKTIGAFNKSLYSGAANSGQTVEGMARIALSVAELTGSISEARDAVMALAASGKSGEIQFKNLAQAAAAVGQFTGQSAAEVAKSFGSLGDSATKAAQKISQQYGLIAAEQYELIRSLEEQGRTEEANDKLSESLNSNAQARLRQYRQSLSEVEKDWNSIGTAISNAYTKVKAELFPDQNKEIEIAQRILDRRKNGGFIGALSNLFSFGDNTNQALKSKVKLLTEGREQYAKAAQEAAAETRANQERIDAEGRWESSQLEYLDKQSKKRKEIADARELGLKAGRSEEEIAKRISAIEEKYADKRKPKKPKTPREDNRGVSEAENTFSRLYGQYDPAAQAARDLAKEQGQLDLALSKGRITQEEYGKALAQASTNYAAAIKGAQGLTAVEQYRAQLQRQLVNEQTQYQLDAASVGMGDLQASRMQQRLNLEMQTNDRLLQLQTELATASDEKQRQALQGQINAINEFLPQQVAAMQAGWAQMDQAMLNPINGWTAAVQNFGNQARDIAGQTQSIFSSAFNTISTDVTDAIMNGQLSFSTLGNIARNVARDIISGFVKIGVQMAVNAALNATLGAAAAGENIVLAGTTAAAWAPAAAMASLATLGTNSVPAAAALTSTTALASTLAVIPGFATGGLVSGAGTGTSDSIMARLSDGEFVVNASATKRNRALLEAINSNERISPAGMSRTTSSAQASGGPSAYGINQNINIINQHTGAQVEARRMPNGDVEVIIQEAVKRSVDEVAGQLSNGYGPVVDAGVGAYKWRRPGE
ncbi:tail length tape measure protein [Pseudomonas cremoricolorata]|uniref:Tail length tape measure protein n=2 Tax=Pseudomonas cremoricolorata TaxID=157783 RepID=A0A089YFL9_9PSED|nr:tail length tape measure protein [Pseudomonas cremoricolorata]